MSDTTLPAADRSPRFPFVTVGAALGVLFTFLFLMWLVTTREKEADAQRAADTKAEPKPDAATKLDEVKARNEAALNGVGAKMSRDEARGKLLARLKGPGDTMPFPVPEPAQPAAPKKDEPKKDAKEKQ
ncbi:hypothetical protein GobsT_06020 [Gemmata obscuriglobus]|uniref:Uncharacterized protein n=1 Tax=Gemmata obscuriglobus TaxID=114 RepID=A0A2Z3HGA9_9BACT|nr:hypothetical protein [Gemmata obscuriglobus]AWM40844.1 hypothetical protein C1280_30215 [Gemmata obscuriglobus]QEG25867.1 hypothetical protein GobsT_06020 [Gemmata obscuriglobus]VTR99879.1 unnamed protein product [Gemmata obscuriglobus UQM 2246]